MSWNHFFCINASSKTKIQLLCRNYRISLSKKKKNIFKGKPTCTLSVAPTFEGHNLQVVKSHFQAVFSFYGWQGETLNYGASFLPQWWVVSDYLFGATLHYKSESPFHVRELISSGGRGCAREDLSVEGLFACDQIGCRVRMQWPSALDGGMGWESCTVGLTRLLLHQEFPSSSTPSIVS